LNIKELVFEIKTTLNNWHNQNKTYWDNQDFDSDNLSSVIEKLAYHNYCGWHLHEVYFENVRNNIHDGHMTTNHNVYRNQTMEMIDAFYTTDQNADAKYHSEGFGSIIDRIVNDYIKYLHCVEYSDVKAEGLLNQVEILTDIAADLEEEVLSGTKQILVWKKFKVQYE
jgi:hypothetical protein